MGTVPRSHAGAAPCLLFLVACQVAGATGEATAPAAQGGFAVLDGAFQAQAAAAYRKSLERLSAQGRLDDDATLLGRIRRIAPGLIAAAAALRAETSGWSWEFHATSDPSAATFCMAGGKILVGGDMVRRLGLGDGELATLLGHEIAHAVAGHRRMAPRGGMDRDAAEEVREAEIAVRQETEADEIGMGLAWRAGWPTAEMVSFFDKLAAQEGSGAFSSSHASAAARASRAREIAGSFRR
jgi:predicted Zn-dependent protease